MNRVFRWFKSLKRRSKAVLFLLAFLLLWYVFSLPRSLFDSPYSTLVSDRNGELLGARIANDGQWRFPPSESVPDKYKTCLIQFEDRYFKYHPGVNPLSLGRALIQNSKAGRVVSGGSTITMQTIRLIRQNKRTYFEKFIEVILATRLELSYSKNEILALYASHAPMGGNVVGVEAASWRYFGHSTESMSWGEAAVLAVLPNSPSMMHFGRDREGLKKKRDRLLQRLLDNDIIDKTDYELAVEESLPENPQALPQIAPHLVTRGYLQYPGSNIRSTIDKYLQLHTEETLRRWYDEFSQNNIYNIAALIVDLETNEVLAYSGNVGFDAEKHGSQVDIIHSPRSTGSILKPFLYSAMLQEGSLLPTELLPDVPVNFNGFAPRNFSLGYDGAVHADEALARSLNVPSVVLLRKYGVAKFHDLLKRAGLSTLNQPADHYGLSLILGGTEGTLWDVANIYGMMARTVMDYNRDGKYYEWDDFSLVHDHQSEVRKDEKAELQKDEEPVFNAGAAWLTLEALTNLNRPEELNWHFVPSVRKVAWKTGTSYGLRDGWSVGVTPKYLVAVWTGNASGEGRPGLTGARTSARVMFDLFNILPSTGWFDIPYGELTEVQVCSESGQLKGLYCPESSVETRLVPLKGARASVCSFHQRIHLSEDGRYRVYEQCAGDRGIRPVSWFRLPPSWEWYYKQRFPSYQTLPPFSPECASVSNSDQPMQFIYPYPGAILRITKQLDGSRGKAIFELAHRNPYIKIFWHLGGEYLGETSTIHQMELSPETGDHILTVVDENGETLSIRFKVDV